MRPGDQPRPEPYQRPASSPGVPQLTPKVEMSDLCCISHYELEFPIFPKALLFYFFFSFRKKRFGCKNVLEFFF